MFMIVVMGNLLTTKPPYGNRHLECNSVMSIIRKPFSYKGGDLKCSLILLVTHITCLLFLNMGP